MTASEEVVKLREQVKVLTEQLSHLQDDYNRVEMLYRSESVISMELLDLLRENGIPVREAVERYKGK